MRGAILAALLLVACEEPPRPAEHWKLIVRNEQGDTASVYEGDYCFTYTSGGGLFGTDHMMTGVVNRNHETVAEARAVRGLMTCVRQ